MISKYSLDLIEKYNIPIEQIIFPKKQEIEYKAKPIKNHLREFIEKSTILEKIYLKPFLDYIHSPIILDSFKNDQERNKAELGIYKIEENPKQNYYFYTSNKLRSTRIRNTLQMYDILIAQKIIKQTKTKNDLSEKIWEMVSLFKEHRDFIRYEKSSNQEKIRIANKTRKFSREVCISFIEKSQNTESCLLRIA